MADTLLRNGDAIIALVELEKGIVQPTVKKKGLFKELVKRPAFVKSEYDTHIAMGDSVVEGNVGRSSLMGGYGGTGHEGRKRRVIEDDGGPSWELALGFLLIVGLILWAASGNIKAHFAYKKEMKKKAERLMELMGGKKWNELPYWRELPMQGNLLGSSAVLAGVLYVLKESGNPVRGVEFSVQHLYEAFILRMFYQGGIVLDYDTDKYGKTRQLFRIQAPVKPERKPGLDVTRNATSDYFLSGSRRREVDELYKGLMHDAGIQYMLQDLLYRAADSDHLLQPDELKVYVNKNMEQLRPMADALYRIAGCRVDDRELLMDEVRQVMGFLHYLKDFSLVKERHIEEVSLWKEYLVYASFYGIADQVRQDMKRVAPDTTQLDQMIPPTQVLADFRPITTALASSLATVRMYETDYERRQRRSSYSSGSSGSARSYSSSSGGSGRSSHSGGGGSGFR